MMLHLCMWKLCYTCILLLSVSVVTTSVTVESDSCASVPSSIGTNCTNSNSNRCCDCQNDVLVCDSINDCPKDTVPQCRTQSGSHGDCSVNVTQEIFVICSACAEGSIVEDGACVPEKTRKGWIVLVILVVILLLLIGGYCYWKERKKRKKPRKPDDMSDMWSTNAAPQKELQEIRSYERKKVPREPKENVPMVDPTHERKPNSGIQIYAEPSSPCNNEYAEPELPPPPSVADDTDLPPPPPELLQQPTLPAPASKLYRRDDGEAAYAVSHLTDPNRNTESKQNSHPNKTTDDEQPYMSSFRPDLLPQVPVPTKKGSIIYARSKGGNVAPTPETKERPSIILEDALDGSTNRDNIKFADDEEWD